MEPLKFEYGHGRRYEDTYGGWLGTFQKIAEAPNGTYDVHNHPAGWTPLLVYLGAWKNKRPRGRTRVEESCALHPVLVDALWRADMKWGGERRHLWDSVFTIATYNGFWRPEILKFMRQVDEYQPQKRKCVLVPCAADKPYPSPLHKAVREVVGDNYEIIVVSSAVGLAPEGLWNVMPQYDAGLPLFDRVYERAESYFSKHSSHYEVIVNYTDMLQHDLLSALYSVTRTGSVYLPKHFSRRCDYQPLMSAENLDALRRVLP